MNKIGIIGVYFGKLPNYFPLWLKSCEHNRTIDFLIFTDQEIQFYPNNVKVHKISLQEMKQLAIKALGLDVSLERPYKCCDFKPVYGLIFENYLKHYDYWGHCDFDLIFGDLTSFFEKYHLYDYDKFLLLGHLSLYKNTKEINSRYLLSGSDSDYKKVFTTDCNYAFDELSGIAKIYFEHNFKVFKDRIFCDISTKNKRYKITTQYPYGDTPQNYKYQIFYWENGKTYREYISRGKIYREEYLYIHFQKRPNYIYDFDESSASGFYITEKGFFEKNKPTTKKQLKKNTPIFRYVFEPFEYICKKYNKKVKRKLKGIFSKKK